MELRTFADIQRRVGNVSPDRILVEKPTGPLARRDLIRETVSGDRHYELVGGVFVEKLTHFGNAVAFMGLLGPLGNHVFGNNLGVLCGGKALLRLASDVIRIPGCCLFLWGSQDDPTELLSDKGPFLDHVPDLIADVTDRRQTPDELGLKLAEYEKLGVDLVWYIKPEAKTVAVYPKGKVRGSTVLTEADTLDGGKVLPGFALPVRAIFASRLPANLPKKPRKKRK